MRWPGSLYTIKHMLISKNLAIVIIFGDKIELAIARFHCNCINILILTLIQQQLLFTLRELLGLLQLVSFAVCLASESYGYSTGPAFVGLIDSIN